MAKLIDDEKLLAVIEEHCYTLCDRFNSTDKGMFLCGIKQAINEQPKVDTERHAYWDNISLKYSNAKRIDICSCCRAVILRDVDSDKYNYCPNCGCKMDEV